MAQSVNQSIGLTLGPGKQRISAGVHQLEKEREKVLGKIDQVDHKIENEAAKAKSGIMSWFGK